MFRTKLIIRSPIVRIVFAIVALSGEDVDNEGKLKEFERGSFVCVWGGGVVLFVFVVCFFFWFCFFVGGYGEGKQIQRLRGEGRDGKGS